MFLDFVEYASRPANDQKANPLKITDTALYEISFLLRKKSMSDKSNSLKSDTFLSILPL